MKLLIKLGSRLAVLVIIYMLLSIPNANFLARTDLHTHKKPQPLPTVIPAIKATFTGLPADSVSLLYDTLLAEVNKGMASIKSEMSDADSRELAELHSRIGQLTFLAATGSRPALPVLEILWQWQQYLKEQSVFWNLRNDMTRDLLVSRLDEINTLQAFLVINRQLEITIEEGVVRENHLLNLEQIHSGDFIVDDSNLAYPFLSISKIPVALSPVTGIVLVGNDSNACIASLPAHGLHAIPADQLLAKPAGRRMVLRWRSDLPEIIANPTLAHQAASYGYQLSQTLTLPYDYLMDPANHATLFTTEALEYFYEGRQITLFDFVTPTDSAMLLPLNRLGIHPHQQAVAAELTYQNTVKVVALQLSGPQLKAHNLQLAAYRQALLNLNDPATRKIRWLLPWYRLKNFYDLIASWTGMERQLPPGMAPETALAYDHIRTQANKILPQLTAKAEEFARQNGYYPSFAELVLLADDINGP